MTIKTETSLRFFDFWSGAKDHAEMLLPDELDALENELEILYPDGMTATEVNDIMWFDFGFVCELLGYEYDEEHDKVIRSDDDRDEEDDAELVRSVR